jgi:hypothetical protein
MKACNFGPPVNFGFFPEELAIIKTRPTKKREENEKCGKTVELHIRFR